MSTISPSWIFLRANRPQPCIPDLPKQTRWFSVFWNKKKKQMLITSAHKKVKKCQSLSTKQLQHMNRYGLPANGTVDPWRTKKF